MTVEAALGAELDDHLGYDKHDPAGRGSGNSRNGTTRKRLKGQHGEVDIERPATGLALMIPSLSAGPDPTNADGRPDSGSLCQRF
ncbi:transposase [Halopseudomonas pachastrellae]|nr:transposase [Halopseudomonas pachastrellae]